MENKKNILLVDENTNIKEFAIRNGTCPNCGEQISIMLSDEECYFCKQSLKWSDYTIRNKR